MYAEIDFGAVKNSKWSTNCKKRTQTTRNNRKNHENLEILKEGQVLIYHSPTLCMIAYNYE